MPDPLAMNVLNAVVALVGIKALGKYNSPGTPVILTVWLMVLSHPNALVVVKVALYKPVSGKVISGSRFVDDWPSLKVQFHDMGLPVVLSINEK